MDEMTNDAKNKIWQKIGEASLLFLLMGVVIYVLYARMEKTEERMFKMQQQTNERLQVVEEEVMRCRNDNMQILIKSNNNYIEVIKRNNDLLNRIK